MAAPATAARPGATVAMGAAGALEVMEAATDEAEEETPEILDARELAMEERAAEAEAELVAEAATERLKEAATELAEEAREALTEEMEARAEVTERVLTEVRVTT